MSCPVNSYYVLLIFFLGLCACQEQSSDDESRFDTDFLPEGIAVATWQRYEPTGENFQGARIDPPYWWTEMQNDTLELCIYDRDISSFEAEISNPGINVVGTTALDNPNYLFVKVVIAENASPGRYFISLNSGGKLQRTYRYELKRRVFLENKINPVDQDDIIYLLMPDRFANGDTTNDSFEDMLQTGVDRDKMYFRHGGDIQGMTDNLDHIAGLGISAIWPTPLLENDQPYSSYHGYAITDHYEIDKRFGTNNDYIAFASRCQSRGIKVVKDLVFNHVGHKHWFVQDIPSSDWLHQYDEYIGSNHQSPVIRDPYGSEYDRKRMLNGWFDYSMPDLNQEHPNLANYLIQNAIWWIENAGIDGFRLDTYQYCDENFMQDMVRRVRKEYPGFYIFGETWVQRTSLQASFVGGSPLAAAGNNLPGVADFQLNFQLKKALTDSVDIHGGIYQLYYTLASDYLYNDPSRNVTFLDNHDMDRIFAVVDYDPERLKSAISLLMTLRGIPCIYYGTEFGFGYRADPDGKVRPDMPGGWPGDRRSVFDRSQLTEEERRIYDHLWTMITARHEHEALRAGVTTQFAPQGNEGVFTYFRSTQEETIAVMYNSRSDSSKVDPLRFAEVMPRVQYAQDIPTQRIVDLTRPITVAPHATLVLVAGK